MRFKDIIDGLVEHTAIDDATVADGAVEDAVVDNGIGG